MFKTPEQVNELRSLLATDRESFLNAFTICLEHAQVHIHSTSLQAGCWDMKDFKTEAADAFVEAANNLGISVKLGEGAKQVVADIFSAHGMGGVSNDKMHTFIASDLIRAALLMEHSPGDKCKDFPGFFEVEVHLASVICKVIDWAMARGYTKLPLCIAGFLLSAWRATDKPKKESKIKKNRDIPPNTRDN